MADKRERKPGPSSSLPSGRGASTNGYGRFRRQLVRFNLAYSLFLNNPFETSNDTLLGTGLAGRDIVFRFRKRIRSLLGRLRRTLQRFMELSVPEIVSDYLAGKGLKFSSL